jgi:hypothetical protein
VHPDPYYRVSKAEVRVRREQLESSLNTPLSPSEFAARLRALLLTFADVPHTNVSAPRKRVASSPGPFHPRWAFSWLPGNVGYLDLFGMPGEGRDDWQRFLAENFKALHDRNASGLVIDLRRDGGGDSSLGDDLLSYITAKPYRQATRKEWKFSATYMESPGCKAYWQGLNSHPPPPNTPPNAEQRKFLAQNPSVRFKRLILSQSPEWARRYLAQYAPHWLDSAYSPETASDTMVFDLSQLETPPANYRFRFGGPICVLIGQGTFSSGIMLGNTIQDFHLATLIGEETKPCNEFGEVYEFRLPHSCLNAQCPSARFIRANGDAADQHGIVPDIPAPAPPPGTAASDDPGIQAALAHIAQARYDKFDQSGAAAK